MLSIRARLVVLALLAVVPLMIDRVRLLEASRVERIDEAAAEVLELTKRGADGQREIITTARAMLKVMARAYVTMLARGETCNLYMKDLVADMPWIKGMSIVGADGADQMRDAALGDRPRYDGPPALLRGDPHPRLRGQRLRHRPRHPHARDHRRSIRCRRSTPRSMPSSWPRSTCNGSAC